MNNLELTVLNDIWKPQAIGRGKVFLWKMTIEQFCIDFSLKVMNQVIFGGGRGDGKVSNEIWKTQTIDRGCFCSEIGSWQWDNLMKISVRYRPSVSISRKSSNMNEALEQQRVHMCMSVEKKLSSLNNSCFIKKTLSEY